MYRNTSRPELRSIRPNSQSHAVSADNHNCNYSTEIFFRHLYNFLTLHPLFFPLGTPISIGPKATPSQMFQVQALRSFILQIIVFMSLFFLRSANIYFISLCCRYFKLHQDGRYIKQRNLLACNRLLSCRDSGICFRDVLHVCHLEPVPLLQLLLMWCGLPLRKPYKWLPVD